MTAERACHVEFEDRGEVWRAFEVHTDAVSSSQVTIIFGIRALQLLSVGVWIIQRKPRGRGQSFKSTFEILTLSLL